MKGARNTCSYDLHVHIRSCKPDSCFVTVSVGYFTPYRPYRARTPAPYPYPAFHCIRSLGLALGVGLGLVLGLGVGLALGVGLGLGLGLGVGLGLAFHAFHCICHQFMRFVDDRGGGHSRPHTSNRLHIQVRCRV